MTTQSPLASSLLHHASIGSPVSIIDTLEKAIMESGKRSHPPLRLKRKQMSPAVWAEGPRVWNPASVTVRINTTWDQRWSFSSHLLHLKFLKLLLQDSKALSTDGQTCFYLLNDLLSDDITINQSYADELLTKVWWGNGEILLKESLLYFNVEHFVGGALLVFSNYGWSNCIRLLHYLS